MPVRDSSPTGIFAPARCAYPMGQMAPRLTLPLA